MPDKHGRIRMVTDGKAVRRVAPELRKRTYTRGTPYERAIARVTVDDNGCWIWNGSTVLAGYGHINVGGGLYRHAHIVTWEHHNGPVPEGLELDHLCRVRPCVNPAHLEAVTHQENVQRGLAAMRSCDHPDEEFYRRKSGPEAGRLVYCRICRRANRPSTATPGECELCGAGFIGRSDRKYCGAKCRREARTIRDREVRRARS